MRGPQSELYRGLTIALAAWSFKWWCATSNYNVYFNRFSFIDFQIFSCINRRSRQYFNYYLLIGSLTIADYFTGIILLKSKY